MKTYITLLLVLTFSGSFAQKDYQINNVKIKNTRNLFDTNEYVHLSFDYISNGEEVQIIAKPVYKGELLASTKAVPSAIINNIKGSAQCSFTLTSPSKVDHIRFRIIENKTSLMIHEYFYTCDLSFTTKQQPVQVKLNAEYPSHDKVFIHGAVINTNETPLSKLVMNIDFNGATLLNAGGIGVKEGSSPLVLYTDLWRNPMKAGESKNFILELAIAENFQLPETCTFNGNKILLETAEEFLAEDEVKTEVTMNILSEWNDGCIVEFNIDGEEIASKELVAKLGEFETIDAWGANYTSEASELSFTEMNTEFGFVATLDKHKLNIPKEISIDDEVIPLKVNNPSRIKSKDKPIVRDAMLAFDLFHEGPTKVSIIDKTGKVVETLYDDEITAGFHTFRWTPINLNEVVYFYLLETNGATLSGEIIF